MQFKLYHFIDYSSIIAHNLFFGFYLVIIMPEADPPLVEKLEIIICYTIIMALRIFMVGGGSGGHAYPLIAVAQELRKQTEERSIDLELVLMGDSNGQFLKAAAGELGVPYIGILSGKLRRYFSVGNLLDAIKVPIGFIQSILYLWTYM